MAAILYARKWMLHKKQEAKSMIQVMDVALTLFKYMSNIGIHDLRAYDEAYLFL